MVIINSSQGYAQLYFVELYELYALLTVVAR